MKRRMDHGSKTKASRFINPFKDDNIQKNFVSNKLVLFMRLNMNPKEVNIPDWVSIHTMDVKKVIQINILASFIL